MYHIQVTRKNCFNKPRAQKANLLEQVIAALPTQSFPNGNSGYNSYYARPILNFFDNCIVRENAGNPNTPNYVLLDASKMTSEQVEKIKDWLKPVQGNKYYHNEFSVLIAMAAYNSSPWEVFARLLNNVVDPKVVAMHRMALINNTSPDRWKPLHTAFDAEGNVLQVGKAEEIREGFAFLHDGRSCLMGHDAELCVPENPEKHIHVWYCPKAGYGYQVNTLS